MSCLSVGGALSSAVNYIRSGCQTIGNRLEAWLTGCSNSEGTVPKNVVNRLQQNIKTDLKNKGFNVTSTPVTKNKGGYIFTLTISKSGKISREEIHELVKETVTKETSGNHEIYKCYKYTVTPTDNEEHTRNNNVLPGQTGSRHSQRSNTQPLTPGNSQKYIDSTSMIIPLKYILSELRPDLKKEIKERKSTVTRKKYAITENAYFMIRELLEHKEGYNSLLNLIKSKKFDLNEMKNKIE